uniref:Uncharacterized protein n=1 Tax=Arion vulgaris TaxID=1028688 RepID=A0A0B7B7J8_9EUPU
MKAVFLKAYCTMSEHKKRTISMKDRLKLYSFKTENKQPINNSDAILVKRSNEE